MSRPHAWSWSLHAHSAGKTHEDVIATCRASSATTIEMWHTMLEERSDAELDRIARAYLDAGLHLDSFHFPFGPAENEISGFYEIHRSQATDLALTWIARLERFKVRVMIFHPAHGTSGVRREGIDMYLRQLGRSLEMILPAAEKSGVDIALENMLPGTDLDRFGSQPEHFNQIRKSFAHPRLKFCLDTGHALVSVGQDRLAEFFDAMGDELAAFHLADNAGDRDSHLAPGHGLVDWDLVFGKMLSMKYGFGACIEAPPFAPGPPYEHAAWRTMLQELDRLVGSAAAKLKNGNQPR